jgi:Uma2 family endonuclease
MYNQGGMKTMGLPAKKPDAQYTYGDYKFWPEDERWELIDGVAWNMSHADDDTQLDGSKSAFRYYLAPDGSKETPILRSPLTLSSPAKAPGRRHQEIAGELYHIIRTFLEGKTCRAFIAPFDVLLPERSDQPEDEVASVVQPDVLVFCDQAKLTDKGATGAPDLVIEVITPWTHKKDLNEKLVLYERHGVREFWIIDPGNRSVLFFKLTTDRLYGEPNVLVASDRLESAVLSGLSIDLAALFSLV